MARVVIAAPKSGSGKTTVTCALTWALKEKGKTVRSFKCGPDYIDPMFHKEILGVPSKNLDLFFTGEEQTRQLFLHGNDADISVIEGVMGLYDGLGGVSEEDSTYHLAKVLRAPIILVVDAHGMGRSLLAELKGFLSYDEASLIRGVILNKTTKSWCDRIAPIVEKELGISVLGFFPKQEDLVISSRHLGLTMPKEQENLLEKVKQAAEVLAESVDLSRLIAISENGKPLTEKAVPLRTMKKDGLLRIGVAFDEAFCFYYEDNLRLLEEAGAKLIFFSPLHDKALPENLSGLLLGGGYPELYARQLAQNVSMLTSIREAIKEGIPSLAECGGFMYLHTGINGEDGKFYNMVGLIEGTCEKKERLVRFGYASFAECEPCFLPEGKAIKGHEFHYYDSTNNGCDVVAKKPVGNREWKACHVGANHWWGFAHLYYASCPEFASAFVDRCNKWESSQKASVPAEAMFKESTPSAIGIFTT